MLTELTDKRIKHVNNKEKLLGIGMKTVISDLIKKRKKISCSGVVAFCELFLSCTECTFDLINKKMSH